MNLEATASADNADAPIPASATRLYVPLPAGTSPLRVIVVAPPQVPAWILRFLNLAALSQCVTPVVVPVSDTPPRLTMDDVALDLRGYLALERLRRRAGGAACAPLSIAGNNAVHDPAFKVGSDIGQLRARVAALQPDVVLLLGRPAWAEVLAECAPWGCWSLDSSLVDVSHAGLPLLAPVLANDSATAVELELACGNEPPIALARSFGASSRGSFNLQREQAFLKLPALLLRVLRQLARGGLNVPARQPATLRLAPASIPLGIGGGVRALSIALLQTARWQLRKRRREEPWLVLMRNSTEPLDPGAPEIGPVSTLIAPSESYWADPCIIEYHGRHLLFVEEYAMRTRKGVIACLELHADGTAQRLGIALDEPFHLSYPQAFMWEGHWYLTVESATAHRVSLYRACDFPVRWQRIADLISGCVCVDPTLYFHEGHWYLFVNISESGGSNADELFLFVADSPIGPFRPHPLNPIVCDVRRARPAGRLFRHDGRLIRPGQDCAPSYGAAVVFNEVLELSPTRYHERPLARLDTRMVPSLDGCHTYNAAYQAEVLDGRGVPPVEARRMSITERPVAARCRFTGTPLVSAITPAYNAERFLGEAIESVLGQSFADLEIVIVNDGSRDGTGALADRYAAENPGRVRVVHQENKGLPLARNAAIDAARGRYLALLDADDVWLPGHIESCVARLESDSALGLVHANVEYIDGEGKLLGTESESGRWSHDGLDPYTEVLLRRQHVTCPTAVFRRSVVDAIGAFDAQFNRLGCEDRDMWLRIAEVSELAYIDEVQALYRVHGANMSGNYEQMWRARQVLVNKHIARPCGRPLRRRALAAIFADRGHELAIEAPPMPALAAFARALSRDPFRVDAWKGLLRRVLVGRRPGVVLPRGDLSYENMVARAKRYRASGDP